MPFETINQNACISQNLFNSEGLFSKHVEDVVRSILLQDKSLVKSFNSLETAGDRLNFLKKHASNLDFTTKVPSDDAFVKQDLSQAIHYKEKGNELFKANRLLEAKDMYTKAVQHCPLDRTDVTSNKDYAIILANRSACTDKIGLYEASVQDIDDAFKHGYPRQYHYKVHNRKGHALLKLKRYADARSSFLSCKDMVGKSDMPNQEMRDKYRRKLAKQMSVFNVKKGVSNDQVYLAGSPLTQLTSEQKCLFDDGINLKDDVSCEDVILCEVPFAIVLQDNMAEGKICPDTLGVLLAPVPCSFGSKALFANEEARRHAEETFHRYEWGSLHLIQAADLLPATKLALRIVTTIQPKNVGEVVKHIMAETQISNGTLTITAHESLEQRSLDENEKIQKQAINLLALGNPKEDMQVTGDENIRLAVLVAFMITCLEKSGFFNDINNSPTQEDVAVLLERCLLFTAVPKDNVQSVFYSQGSVDKSQLWEMPCLPVKEFALAVYSDFYASRHLQKEKEQLSNIAVKVKADERSDVILGYHKGKLFLQSLRELKSGHVVNLQNVVGAGSAIKATNNANIPAQLANMVTYKCSGKTCSLSFPLPEKTGENVIVCPLDECGTETNIWSRRKLIVELRRDHEAARGKIEGISGVGGVKGIDEGVTIIKYLLEEWDKIVLRPNKDITFLEQDLTKAILLKHFESEQEYIQRNKW